MWFALRQLSARTERSSSSIGVFIMLPCVPVSRIAASCSAIELGKRTNRLRCCVNSSAAWLTASSGDMVPSVQTSMSRRSKSVDCPTRVFSTVKFAFSTGEKIASIGMTPIGWPSRLLRSAGT